MRSKSTAASVEKQGPIQTKKRSGNILPPVGSASAGFRFAPHPLDPCLTNGKRCLSAGQARSGKSPVFDVKVALPAHVSLALLSGLDLTDDQVPALDWQVTITPVGLTGDKQKALVQLLRLLGAMPPCNCPDCRAERMP
jgi:hypothetical protein